MISSGVISVLEELASNVGPRVGQGVISSDPIAAALPDEHRRLLAHLNGFTLFNGAFRVFGTSREPWADIAEWNREERWRFAWDSRIEGFVIFGATAWGDLYAYRTADGGDLGREVHFLEASLLRSEIIAPSFSEFVRNELIANADAPYDVKVVEAVSRWGPVDFGSLWAYSPPVVLGGEEDVDRVVTLPAFTAMTFAGDLACCLRDMSPDAALLGVEPFVDDHGRNRLRVLSA